MKYAQINSFSNGSTGTIMMLLHKELLDEGVDSYVFWGRGRQPENKREMKFATELQIRIDGLQTRLFGRAGFYSKAATRKLLKRLDELELGPEDIVHLHNLHGYYVNVEMLFGWLAKHTCKVRWTLHDCWAFTGHCAYFTEVNCMQWKDCCGCQQACPQLNTYPKTIAKSSVKWNFEHKKQVFTQLPSERLTIITPSNWLARRVKESFLGKYPIEVHRNPIDTDVFKPTPSNFRERFGLGDKFIVLGVASPWTKRKGLDVFIDLARELDPEHYAVVAVGLSRKQINQTKDLLVGIPKTQSKQELAEIYTASDVFLNPSIEETYGITVSEAEACNANVIVVEGTACAEIAKTAGVIPFPINIQDLKSIIEMMRNRSRHEMGQR